ncbi:MAG TPA: peptidylprolyl isomerase [Anaerolineales bacterium]|nr:peptidylprolyl isomerase [Anaerolineales bacterium]
MAKQSSNPRVATKKHQARLERERRQINLIRAIAIAGVVIVVLLLVYGYLKLNVLSLREPVAVVNGVKITTQQWQERVRLERINLYNQLNRYQFFQQSFGMDTTQQQQEILAELNTTDTIGQRVLDQMVDDVLVRQEAEKRGITASKEEVEKMLQEAYSFYPNGSPTPTITPTEVTYPTMSAQELTIYPSTATATEAPTETGVPSSTPDAAVTATATFTASPPTPSPVPELPTQSPTPYTLEGFQKEYNDTLTQFKGYGISEQTVRDVYEVQVLRTKLQKDIAKDLPHSEVQVWARHILVDTEVAAKQVEELLKAGEPFDKVARDLSKDTGSATKGGDLGWAPASNYVTEFKDAVLKQEIGVIGPPVKTQYGFHIIQVIARKELPLTNDQFEQSVQMAFNDWLTAAREKADKKIYDVWKQRVPTEPVLGQQ